MQTKQMREDAQTALRLVGVAIVTEAEVTCYPEVLRRLAAHAEECARMKEGVRKIRDDCAACDLPLRANYVTDQLTALLTETQPTGEPGEETGT